MGIVIGHAGEIVRFNFEEEVLAIPPSRTEASSYREKVVLELLQPYVPMLGGSSSLPNALLMRDILSAAEERDIGPQALAATLRAIRRPEFFQFLPRLYRAGLPESDIWNLFKFIEANTRGSQQFFGDYRSYIDNISDVLEQLVAMLSAGEARSFDTVQIFKRFFNILKGLFDRKKDMKEWVEFYIAAMQAGIDIVRFDRLEINCSLRILADFFRASQEAGIDANTIMGIYNDFAGRDRFRGMENIVFEVSTSAVRAGIKVNVFVFVFLMIGLRPDKGEIFDALPNAFHSARARGLSADSIGQVIQKLEKGVGGFGRKVPLRSILAELQDGQAGAAVSEDAPTWDEDLPAGISPDSQSKVLDLSAVTVHDESGRSSDSQRNYHRVSPALRSRSYIMLNRRGMRVSTVIG